MISLRTKLILKINYLCYYKSDPVFYKNTFRDIKRGEGYTFHFKIEEKQLSFTRRNKKTLNYSASSSRISDVDPKVLFNNTKYIYVPKESTYSS